MIKLLVIIAVTFAACTSNPNVDGLLLTDLNTKKVYMLKHSAGDVYFVLERKLVISGVDTFFVFR